MDPTKQEDREAVAKSVVRTWPLEHLQEYATACLADDLQSHPEMWEEALEVHDEVEAKAKKCASVGREALLNPLQAERKEESRQEAISEVEYVLKNILFQMHGDHRFCECNRDRP